MNSALSTMLREPPTLTVSPVVDPVTGGPHTAHTTNPVPVILVGGPAGAVLRTGGRLADLSPTLLALVGVEQPPEMTGRSLMLP